MAYEDVLTMAGTASASDERAALEDFEALVRLHQRRIYRLLLAITRDRDAAETLTQECFLNAYRQREAFRGGSQVSTWLVSIAVNLARDWMRNRRLMFWRSVSRNAEDLAALALASPAPTAERGLLAAEELQAVWAAVERLSAQQRTVFLLRFVEEMSLEEIAAVTALRTGSVKSHLARALASVRARVRDAAAPPRESSALGAEMQRALRTGEKE